MDMAEEDGGGGPRRPIPAYDINNDENYAPDTLEYDKMLKRKRNPELTRQNACFICDAGKVWEENFRLKKYEPLPDKVVKALNDNATDFLRDGILEGKGFRLLANIFNDGVVALQKPTSENPLDSTDPSEICPLFQGTATTDGVTVVPYKKVGEDEMERHFTMCSDSPIVHIYNLQRKYKKISHEIHSQEVIVYKHTTKFDSTGKKPITKINSYALRDAIVADRMLIYSSQLLDKAIRTTTGNFFK